ncbi:MAG TPA: hypothetical protein VNF50_10625 [Acidimicrobiales bacterium]|nr:hypothetical protein [Acidimicrobiales bacterium]
MPRWDLLAELLGSTNPVGRLLDDTDEKLLCRFCYLLVPAGPLRGALPPPGPGPNCRLPRSAAR